MKACQHSTPTPPSRRTASFALDLHVPLPLHLDRLRVLATRRITLVILGALSVWGTLRVKSGSTPVLFMLGGMTFLPGE